MNSLRYGIVQSIPENRKRVSCMPPEKVFYLKDYTLKFLIRIQDNVGS